MDNTEYRPIVRLLEMTLLKLDDCVEDAQNLRFKIDDIYWTHGICGIWRYLYKRCEISKVERNQLMIFLRGRMVESKEFSGYFARPGKIEPRREWLKEAIKDAASNPKYSNFKVTYSDKY